MYHKETNTYRATDGTGSYDWIFEGIDFTPEYASMTDDDIKDWAAQIIEQSKESDIEEVTAMSEEKPDGWLEAKLEEIESDCSDEYDFVEKAIREWIATESAATTDDMAVLVEGTNEVTVGLGGEVE